MRRIGILGLCLVTVFALTAFVTSAAQAAQLGKCVTAKKVGHKHVGHFLDKYCTQPSEALEGKYEWEPLKIPMRFVAEGGTSFLRSAFGEIQCAHFADEGEFLPGGENDTQVFRFTGCRDFPFEMTCQSATTAGEIVTYQIDGTLIGHGQKGLGGKEPASGEIWIQLTAAELHNSPFGTGPWLAGFECPPVIPLVVAGSVSGVIPQEYIATALKKGKPGKRERPGKPSFTEEFTEQGGEQDLETTFVNPENNFEVETGPSIQEGINEVVLVPYEKGLEFDDY